jgi:outer membrane protein assembly factor BamB
MTHLLALALSPFVLVSGGNDSWPGWRGPMGSGVASGSPPIEWSEQENVRWKTPVPGRGLSSPIVWEGRVFVTTAIGTGKKAESAPAEAGAEGGRGERGREGGPPGGGPPEGGGPEGGRERGRGGFGRGAPIEEQDFVVLALDRKTGAVQWQKKLSTAMPHQGTHRDGSYASPTPVTDGQRLYVSFGSYGIHALDLTGAVQWSVDLGDMDINNGFGEGSSPVLCGELLILSWDHEGDSFLVALDKASGKERWRAPRARGTSWSSPVVVEAGGARQILVAGPVTVAYEPATGKELWREGAAPEGRGGGFITTPVVLDGLVVFATGGRRGGEARAWVIEPAEAGEKAEPLLWKETLDGPHVPSPLAYDGKVYLLKQDSGILSVLDPSSGKLEYGPERLEGVADVYASPVAASGRLYVAGRDGTVEVLSAWPEIATLAVNKLDEGIDASPAIAGDELFLRGLAHLYCVAQ